MKNLILFVFIIASFNLKAQDFRDTVNVVNYQINLTISDSEKQTITGNTVITLHPNFDNIKAIKLDLAQLNIDKVQMNNKELKKISHNNGVITINLDKQIDKKDTIKINIFYAGKPIKDDQWGGFYFMKKSIFNMGVGMASNPPNFGRCWYPCIDNFTDRATYNYNITVKKGLKAICSGILVNVIANKDNTNTFCWELNTEIPTYLSSMAVGNYTLINDMFKKNSHVTAQIYVYPESVDNLKKSFANLERCFEIFEKYFGAYRWSRIGFVETDFNSGAMEHATNITYPSYAIDGTLDNERLMVHEFAHNWFGNLVTCKTEKDMWLNEGWATYCEAIFVQKLYGDQKFKDYVRANHLYVINYANINDGGYFPIYGIPHDITYGTTVYKKGASTVHNLRNYLTDDIFFAAVKKYLNDFKFKSIDTKIFLDSIAAYSNINLKDFAEFYIYEKGFNLFEINQWNVNKVNNFYEVQIKIKQRLIQATKFAKNINLEVTFMNDNLEKITKTINCSDEISESKFTLEWIPTAVFLDLEEKMLDASTHCYKNIATPNNYEFESTLFETEVKTISKNIFLQVKNNFIKPENNTATGFTLAENQYWTITGIIADTKLSGKFLFYNDKYVNSFYKINKNLVLLYRKDQTQQWKLVETQKETNALIINQLELGEYCFAIPK